MKKERENYRLSKFGRGLKLLSIQTIFATLLLSALACTVYASGPIMSCEELMDINLTLVDIEGAPTRLDSAVLSEDEKTCDVTGYVAPSVKFQVKLPLDWSGRFYMGGCGGYCGFVRCPEPNGLFPDGTMAVTAGTNLGHDKSESLFSDGLWAIDNPQGIVDFAYLGMHKTTLAAKALINSFYGQGPEYSYYVGCSDGGREGLQEVQRYPQDYDGVIVSAPVIDEIATNTFYHAWNARVNTDKNGNAILTANKIEALHDAVMEECGEIFPAGTIDPITMADLSGTIDPILKDPRTCSFDARSMLCPDGEDSDSCLTLNQALVANKLWQGPVDRKGIHLSAGDMPYGSELSWVGSMVPKATTDGSMALQNIGDAQWSYDFPNYMSRFDEITGITYMNIVFDQKEFRYLHELAGIYNPTNPDLSAFAANGGKIIIYHGWGDAGASPYMSLNYYAAVKEELGEEVASSFISLYMIPGMGHCGGGIYSPVMDFLTPITDWVEKGIVPDKVVVEYQNNGEFQRSLPVYPYPYVSAYEDGNAMYESSFAKDEQNASVSDIYEWLGLSMYNRHHTKWWTPKEGIIRKKEKNLKK